MAIVTRLVTYADVGYNPYHPGRVSVAARHELELTDGRRVLLLNDRGWGSGGSWAETSVEIVRETTRMVVGPDEPPTGRSQEDMARLHWTSLQEVARQQGVTIDADELRQLPHDVVLSPRLLARIGANSETE